MSTMEPRKVALAGSYTVERASELKDQLLEALNGSDAVDLDISGLTGGDLAMLQVLCSAQKTCAARGKAIRPSQPLQERLGELIQSSGLEQTCCLCSEQSCFIRQG